MKAAEFIDKVQEVYTKYNSNLQTREVLSYLQRKSERYLELLYIMVRINLTPKYKTPPDIADMEVFKKDIINEIATHPEKVPLLTEGAAPKSDTNKYLTLLNDTLRRGKDPRKNEELKKIVKKYTQWGTE